MSAYREARREEAPATTWWDRMVAACTRRPVVPARPEPKPPPDGLSAEAARALGEWPWKSLEAQIRNQAASGETGLLLPASRVGSHRDRLAALGYKVELASLRDHVWVRW